MRKLLAVFGLAALVLLLGNMTMMSQQEYTAEQMAAWQAIAETYYTPGVDPNFMLGKDRVVFDDIKTGMIAPDFTLLDMEGAQHSLSDYVGKVFILLNTGSWY